MVYGRPFEPNVDGALASLAAQAIAGPAMETLLKSVLAGWLIALMVWLLPSASSARMLIIILVTYVVALAKLNHVIAGSVESAYAVLTGAADVGGYLLRFLVPTLIGNIIGGVLLTAILNHAPVAEELEGKPE
jgi:formate/nitrite transporter FocA (FNT family)